MWDEVIQWNRPWPKIEVLEEYTAITKVAPDVKFELRWLLAGGVLNYGD